MDILSAKALAAYWSAAIRANLKHAAHIQIASVPGRHEPDRGAVDYLPLFGELDSVGYKGWVGCEYRPQHGTEVGLSWMQRLGIRSP
jgi:hydroxypyruvate isomerase